MLVIIGLANLLIGIFIGVSGIAGFLLPIMYTAVLGFMITDSMTMSFGAFLVSGVIGSYYYYKSGDIDMSIAYKMGIGSILGALLGVFINNLVPVSLAKMALYIMVLLSGLSLYLKKRNNTEEDAISPLMSNNIFLVVMGFLIALISSFTGAGGPILTVPLLTTLGINVRKSVGISLFNSIFIAFAAFMGYQRLATLPDIKTLVLICMVFHGFGVMFGAKISEKINPNILKGFVSAISVVFSCFMLYKMM